MGLEELVVIPTLCKPLETWGTPGKSGWSKIGGLCTSQMAVLPSSVLEPPEEQQLSRPSCQWHHTHQRQQVRADSAPELVTVQMAGETAADHEKPLVHIFTDSQVIAKS